VWKRDATDGSNDGFSLNAFKARYGCGEYCSLELWGPDTLTCDVPNGTYTVKQNLIGTSTNVEVSAPGSLSIFTYPSPLVFGESGTVNEGYAIVTYDEDDDYEITFISTPSSGSEGYCNDPITISGTAPECCVPPTCTITGPTIVCPSSLSTFCAPENAGPYLWEVTGNGTTSDPLDGRCINVTAGTTCNTTYTVTLTLGAPGCTSSCSEIITIEDTEAPVVSCPTVTTPIECPATPNFPAATATDDCDASVTPTSSDVTTPSGICPQEYSVTRTWTAVDDCGNSSTCSRTIFVTDNTPPVISCPTVTTPIECPATPNFPAATATDDCDASVAPSVTIECSDPFPMMPGTPTATDLCDNSIQITFNGQTGTQGDCPDEYVVTRTWTAVDDCGNSVTATQTVTVWDTQAPVFNNAPANITVMCGMVPPVPVVTATDNCDNYTPVTYLGETGNGPDCPYTITRRWSTMDDCGNGNLYTQIIAVGAQGYRDTGQEGRSQDEKTVMPILLLAPNPALDEVWVSFEADTENEATLNLFDMNGRLVKQQAFVATGGLNRYRIDLADIAKGGMYTVQLLVADKSAVARLMVLKN
jgi:hypothetical protein